MGDNKIGDDKNEGDLLAILIAMGMQQYDMIRITWWITSRVSLEATECRHLASACAVLHRRLPWSTILLKQHKKALTKHNF